MDTQPVRRYRFAGFVVDALRRQVVGPDGEPRPLSARALDILIFLLENRHRVVGKQELMQAAWPHTVVEENNLNQAVSGARRALGDSRESPRFILTVSGRGYQFIGEIDSDVGAATEVHAAIDRETTAAGSHQAAQAVEPAPEPGAEPGGEPTGSVALAAGRPKVSRRRLFIAVAATAAAAAGAWWWASRREASPPVSLAVLPFRPLDDGTRDAAVEVGIAELLINRLSTLPGLVVAPLSSVLRYADSDRDPAAVARELEVQAVLEGHVQIRDGRIRLTARLLDAASGTSLWAGDFTERLDDFFAMQDSLATQLVAALAPNLPPAARERLYRHDTNDVEAWQLYANGRYHVARRSEASIRQAIEYFAAAERRDPSFALAAAGLSEAQAMLGVFGIEPPAVALEAAREAAQRALAADPGLAEAYTAMGQVVTQLDRNLEEGREYYRRALKIRPDHALGHAYMALSLTMSGRLTDAMDSIGRAQRLEPASMHFGAIAGFVSYFARDYAEAERRLGSVARAVPDAPLPRQFLARVLLQQGRPEEVLSLLEGRNEPAPVAFSNLGRAFALAGRRAEAAAEVARITALGERGFGVGFDLALLQLALGDTPAALAALERSVDDLSQTALYANVEPALDPIRDHSRFRAVLTRLRLA